MNNPPTSTISKASVSKKKIKPLAVKKHKMTLRNSVWKEKVDKQPLSKPPHATQEGVIRVEHSPGSEVTIKGAQKAAKKAWNTLLGQGMAVTFQKVVKQTLVALGCPSLKSLGFCISDVPCLQRLSYLEGKINTIISCHLAVRNVTTLYDLSQDILSAEGTQSLDDFRIGPIALHPLVIEHFNPPKGLKICRITAMDVMKYLSEYMGKDADDVASNIKLKDFLSYTLKRRHLFSTNQLCVRIQNFGFLVSQIRQQKEAGARLACYKDAQAPCRPIEAAKSKIQGSMETPVVTRPQINSDSTEFQKFSKKKLEDVSISSVVQEDTRFVNLSSREQSCANHLSAEQAALGNHLGEAIVFNRLVERYGSKHVTWMNAEFESGLPYDILVEEGDGESFFLVKVTWLAEQSDWFEINNREWELANDNDKRFVIVRVFFSGISGSARLVWLPNPSKLCQEGAIKLALIGPQVGINA